MVLWSEEFLNQSENGFAELLAAPQQVSAQLKAEELGSELLTWWKLREIKFPLTPALSPGEREPRQPLRA
jgi:hypothetical protein